MWRIKILFQSNKVLNEIREKVKKNEKVKEQQTNKQI